MWTPDILKFRHVHVFFHLVVNSLFELFLIYIKYIDSIQYFDLEDRDVRKQKKKKKESLATLGSIFNTGNDRIIMARPLAKFLTGMNKCI